MTFCTVPDWVVYMPRVMLAVAKVFLYDITALSDLHRFLSFVALGASLIGIGVLYQKFVFKDR